MAKRMRFTASSPGSTLEASAVDDISACALLDSRTDTGYELQVNVWLLPADERQIRYWNERKFAIIDLGGYKYNKNGFRSATEYAARMYVQGDRPLTGFTMDPLTLGERALIELAIAGAAELVGVGLTAIGYDEGAAPGPARREPAPVVLYITDQDLRTKKKLEEVLKGRDIPYTVNDVTDDEASPAEEAGPDFAEDEATTDRTTDPATDPARGAGASAGTSGSMSAATSAMLGRSLGSLASMRCSRAGASTCPCSVRTVTPSARGCTSARR